MAAGLEKLLRGRPTETIQTNKPENSGVKDQKKTTILTTELAQKLNGAYLGKLSNGAFLEDLKMNASKRKKLRGNNEYPHKAWLEIIDNLDKKQKIQLNTVLFNTQKSYLTVGDIRKQTSEQIASKPSLSSELALFLQTAFAKPESSTIIEK